MRGRVYNYRVHYYWMSRCATFYLRISLWLVPGLLIDYARVVQVLWSDKKDICYKHMLGSDQAACLSECACCTFGIPNTMISYITALWTDVQKTSKAFNENTNMLLTRLKDHPFCRLIPSYSVITANFALHNGFDTERKLNNIWYHGYDDCHFLSPGKNLFQSHILV